MLSNMDLKKEFGKHIGLFPFIEKNIEGASIYFSASQYAWSLKSHQTVVNEIGRASCRERVSA